jgi:hypothetical protein
VCRSLSRSWSRRSWRAGCCASLARQWLAGDLIGHGGHLASVEPIQHHCRGMRMARPRGRELRPVGDQQEYRQSSRAIGVRRHTAAVEKLGLDQAFQRFPQQPEKDLPPPLHCRSIFDSGNVCRRPAPPVSANSRLYVDAHRDPLRQAHPGEDRVYVYEPLTVTTRQAREGKWLGRGYERPVAVAKHLISSLAQRGVTRCGGHGPGLCGGATLLLDPIGSWPAP